MPGVGEFPMMQRRADAEAFFAAAAPEVGRFRERLYRRERRVRAEFGSAAFYHLTTWHRGTPVVAGRERHTFTAVFRASLIDLFGVYDSIYDSPAAAPRVTA
jgi:hypothetical protein